MREEFFAASWTRQEQEANRRIFRAFTHSLVTKGQGILKTVERKKTAWSQYGGISKALLAELAASDLDQDSKDRIYNQRTEEYKRSACYPIASIDVDPSSFYYIKGENGFTFCSEAKVIPYYEAFSRYAVGVNSKGQVVPQAMGLPMPEASKAMRARGSQMLTLTEVWDWQECMYILQGPGDKKLRNGGHSGMVVKRLKHGYGNRDLKTLRGPYFQALGITTSSRDVEKEGLSVLFGYLHLFPLLDSLLTIQSQAAYAFGFPAFKRSRKNELGPTEAPFGEDALEREAATEEIVPGTVYPDDIEPINMPHGGVDLDKAIAMVRNLLEMALPSVAQGMMSGAESGYAVNQAAHMAKLAWNPMIENAEFCLAQRAQFESWMIENRIKETVYVWGDVPKTKKTSKRGGRDEGWLALGPDDLKGLHRYTVALNPETPSNEIIELRKHQQKLQMRIESPEDAVEAMGGNAADVERAWLYQEIKNDPAIRDAMKSRIFKRIATVDQVAMGGAPKPGAPPQPGMGGAPNPFPPTPQGAIVPGVGGTPFTLNPSQQQGVGPGIQPPGPPAGAPAGVRNPPANALPIPGGP